MIYSGIDIQEMKQGAYRLLYGHVNNLPWGSFLPHFYEGPKTLTFSLYSSWWATWIWIVNHSHNLFLLYLQRDEEVKTLKTFSLWYKIHKGLLSTS